MVTEYLRTLSTFTFNFDLNKRKSNHNSKRIYFAIGGKSEKRLGTLFIINYSKCIL